MKAIPKSEITVENSTVSFIDQFDRRQSLVCAGDHEIAAVVKAIKLGNAEIAEMPVAACREEL